MRSGASGRPRCSCNSVNARLRVLWSLARRSRWRVSSSWALRVTVSSSARLSPRRGTRTLTREPRSIASHSSYVARSSGSTAHEHLLRDTLGRVLAVQRLEDAVDQPSGCEVLDLVEHEPLASDDSPLADEEHLHRRLQLVVGDADDIEILAAVGDHLLALDRPADRCQPVAHPGRLLELQRVGGLPHLGLEVAHDRVGVAVEEVAQLVDELAVRHLLDLTDARTGALLDVVQQARPPEPLVLAELGRAAGPDRERAEQLVEGVADRVGMAVRPEVAHALALATPHDHRPGPRLVDGDGEERVALVVAQPDVEPRAVLLDQRPLQHQRLDLVAHRRPLDGLGHFDHLGRPRGHVPGVAEVVRQPVAEARRLADVDDPALGVLELVRARGVRNRASRWALDHQCRGYG